MPCPAGKRCLPIKHVESQAANMRIVIVALECSNDESMHEAVCRRICSCEGRLQKRAPVEWFTPLLGTAATNVLLSTGREGEGVALNLCRRAIIYFSTPKAVLQKFPSTRVHVRACHETLIRMLPVFSLFSNTKVRACMSQQATKRLFPCS